MFASFDDAHDLESPGTVNNIIVLEWQREQESWPQNLFFCFTTIKLQKYLPKASHGSVYEVTN